MRIGYYPGCSLKGTAREYDESFREIASVIGIELVEISDWNCCGSSAAHNLNHEISIALPARILAMAEKDGFDEIVVPCASCYSRLVVAKHEILSTHGMMEKVSEQIGLEFKGNVKPLNILEALSAWKDKISEKIKIPFAYSSACYYGCLLVRPQKIMNFDRYEDPMIMDSIVESIGGKGIDWPSKVDCCGAGFSVSRTETVARLSSKIVADAVNRGADTIVVACPMCQSNLDMRRKEINSYSGKEYSIPVLYITQAVGLALGIDEKKLGLHRHVVEVRLQPKAADKKAAS